MDGGDDENIRLLNVLVADVAGQRAAAEERPDQMAGQLELVRGARCSVAGSLVVFASHCQCLGVLSTNDEAGMDSLSLIHSLCLTLSLTRRSFGR